MMIIIIIVFFFNRKFIKIAKKILNFCNKVTKMLQKILCCRIKVYFCEKLTKITIGGKI